MYYITNAFSVQMLTSSANVRFAQADLNTVRHIVKNSNIKSFIKHQNLIDILEPLLGYKFELSRESAKLLNDVPVIVAQYRGPRMEEGDTKLPPNGSIEFWIVRFLEPSKGPDFYREKLADVVNNCNQTLDKIKSNLTKR